VTTVNIVIGIFVDRFFFEFFLLGLIFQRRCPVVKSCSSKGSLGVLFKLSLLAQQIINLFKLVELEENVHLLGNLDGLFHGINLLGAKNL
jgi:hypothetical protein